MRNSISKRMLSRFSERFRGVGCVRAGGLALCVALLTTSTGAQPSAGWRIDTIAGTGEPGYGGDDGPAVEARLSFPTGVAVDSVGNVYIAGFYSQRIRRVDTAGIITTVAGSGDPGYNGDGQATGAQLLFPSGVAVDHADNLFITDTGNHLVRRIDTTGTIVTVAGSGERGFDWDGAALESQLSRPTGVAVDGLGNLYFAGYDNYGIRRVDAGGNMRRVEGSQEPYAGPGDEEWDSRDRGIAVDDAGNVYIANVDDNYIRRVDATGTVSVIAGTPRDPGFSGDGGPAAEAQLSYPADVALDHEGNIYIADTGNHRIRMIDATGTITTIAGTGTAGYSGDGGSAVEAQLASPFALTVDRDGKLYIVDLGNYRIRVLTRRAPLLESIGGLLPLSARAPRPKSIRKLDYSDMDNYGPARVYADFDGDGVLDLFRAVLGGRELGESLIVRRPLEMWIGNGNGTYRRDDGMLPTPSVGGFHPRKAVAADYNGDGREDVIVADHGYDADPFPGAPLLLYLSTADGRLEKAKGLEHIIGYHHSVTAGDIDRDGDTDVFATDTHLLATLLINDGRGNMTLNRAYLPKDPDLVEGFTSELADVDRDGNLDLLVAGHEFEGTSSVILWGAAEPGFANSAMSTLPGVTDFGIVIDIDVADFDDDGIDDILLNRVGSPPGRGFYDGVYLQLLKGSEDRRTFTDITASSIDNAELLENYATDAFHDWFDWLIAQDWDFDGDLDIVVDDLPTRREGLVLINDGRAVFSILEVTQP